MKFGKKSVKLRTASLAHDRGAILRQNAPFAVQEAYKTLRTNIMFSIPADNYKVIGLTSSMASEGKSTNCINLAITFAETGATVLLIDCDLRRPNIARLLDRQATVGLSNVLAGLADIDKAIQKTGYPSLDVMTSGGLSPNPTELLDSAAMGELLSVLAEQYDYIFLDTPPVNLVSDALILSKYLSGILFVVRQNHSEKGSVKEAIRQLEFAGVKVLGFIFNDVHEMRQDRYRYPYDYYGCGSYEYTNEVLND